MNIFYLHEDPDKAAQYQYNKHVVKMILESAQLLCTAHHLLCPEESDLIPYKATHKNHPSAVWVRQSSSNYAWLYFHMMALGKEYKKRYNKEHLTIAKCRDVLAQTPGPIFNIGPTDMPQCMPDEYKDDDYVTAYRKYYQGAKAYFAKWERGVSAPDWWLTQ